MVSQRWLFVVAVTWRSECARISTPVTSSASQTHLHSRNEVTVKHFPLLRLPAICIVDDYNCQILRFKFRSWHDGENRHLYKVGMICLSRYNTTNLIKNIERLQLNIDRVPANGRGRIEESTSTTASAYDTVHQYRNQHINCSSWMPLKPTFS